MSLKDQTDSMLPAIETELHRQIARLDKPYLQPFYNMLNYHMGWISGDQARRASGKRIRPTLLLLVTMSCAGEWLHAIPAAAAIELVHNFSLVHDDIQDNSPIRHGMPTVWKKYGIPMAINVGDTLFAIANQAILDLYDGNTAEKVIKTGRILHNACLDLTCGQFLDISYEKRNDMSMENYWPMIEGKTAALLSACTQIGAILGNADDATVEQYRIFGRDLGLAFQVQDDLIGIWGEEALTGKSTASDLLERKNSLPILYGISQKGEFAQYWFTSELSHEDVVQAAQMLKDEGAYDFSRREAIRLTAQASTALRNANPQGEAGVALAELVNKLLVRDS
jgi:geranylgeranyl diphosphate synthase, type I